MGKSLVFFESRCTKSVGAKTGTSGHRQSSIMTLGLLVEPLSSYKPLKSAEP